MKILISAYACEPNSGSEPGIGWNIARKMADYHEIWVLTWAGRRPAIEAETTRNPVPNLHFIYYGWWGERLWRRSFGLYLHYYLWQIAAYTITFRLNRQLKFDLLHQVTYSTYKIPSFLTFLSVSMIWGPLSGGESAPKSFRKDFNLFGKVYEFLRDVNRWLGEHDPFVRLTLQRSALVLAATEDTAARLNQLGTKDVRVFSFVGLPQSEISHLAEYELPKSNPVRFISIGRLLHWKGFHLSLQAFALNQPKLDGAEYWIIGEGPEHNRLQRLAQTLEISPQVLFWGNLPREDTLNKLGECHVLIHPSLHESGGFVCLEAMAAGRPVICLDLGGPAIQVTKETGYKIPAQNPEQVVHDIADAMHSLAVNPKLRLHLGQAARKRANEMFNWTFKEQFYNQIYKEVSFSQQIDTDSNANPQRT